MLPLDWQPITRHLETARRVAVAVHEKPDGDALGSMLALAEHLEDGGHTVTRFSIEGVPPTFTFLPDSNRVTDVWSGSPDALVLVDIGDVARARVPLSNRGQPPMVLVFDHHPTRLEYEGRAVVDGAVVATHVSSTCELVYHFLRHRNAPLTKSIATNLLTGISTDTGAFQNAATTAEALAAAADLLLRGANLPKIVTATARNKTVSALHLWGRALTRLKHDPTNGQVTTVITRQDVRECGVGEEATDGVSNFLNALDGARFTLVLKEEAGGFIRGSYRTTRDDVDVAALAAQFGGGGHKKAAGFTVKGSLQERDTGWDVIRKDETPQP